jgi:hypothetical protein
LIIVYALSYGDNFKKIFIPLLERVAAVLQELIEGAISNGKDVKAG